jgi:RND family efflux transporter MFP subunit
MSADKQALEGLKLDHAEADLGSARPPWYKWVVLAGLLGAAVAAWRVWPRTIEVRTFVVSATDPVEQRTLLNASGYVTARRQATVSSKITGKVVEVLIEEGRAVKKGEVLARLDDTNAAANLALAEARVKAARSALDETRVRLDVAWRELERIRRLQAGGVATDSDLDQARGTADSLKARLERQTEEIVVAERQRAVYARLLEDTVIRAPFDGMVTTKDAQPGEMISPVSAGGGYTRTGICTVVDMTSLEIEVDVNESYLGRIHADQPVTATLDAYPDWAIPAHVIAIIPTADRQKSTVKVRIAFEHLDPRILPEMAVRVAFLGPAPKGLDDRPALLVPTRAVLREGGRHFVWVVSPDDTARRREVKVGDELDGEIPVLSGLTAGERVVIEGQSRLHEGADVREQTR